jgi:hypothetical protein
MSKLRVDTELLREAAGTLDGVLADLADSELHGQSLADVVGHDRLSYQVQEFANSWDQRRKDLMEEIIAVQDALTDGAQTIDDTDSQLASNLMGED